ncbi:MAG: SDR family NAD(P)-dependent oxidoreductase, partial [Bacteroidia bacterium]|nr:SDR family NAD(P)-dependent oxidoreductase [Bacteroidia bacterium]
MNIDLRGKRAMVGGSTQGIGKAAAFAMAGLGASITLIARNEEALAKVCSELKEKHPGEHEYICADYGDVNTLKQKVTEYV